MFKTKLCNSRSELTATQPAITKEVISVLFANKLLADKIGF